MEFIRAAWAGFPSLPQFLGWVFVALLPSLFVLGICHIGGYRTRNRIDVMQEPHGDQPRLPS